MASDLVLRSARAACRAKGLDPDERLGVHPPPTSDDGMVTFDVMLLHYRWHDEVDAARAVAGELLAALREPGEAAVEHARDRFLDRHGLGYDVPPPEGVRTIARALIDASAREHGLEARQGPREGRSGDGTPSGATADRSTSQTPSTARGGALAVAAPTEDDVRG